MPPLITLFTLTLCAVIHADLTLRQISNDDVAAIEWNLEMELGLDRPLPEIDMLTPLQAASKYNALTMIAQLVEHGVDINKGHPSTKETALMYAARTGSNSAVQLLLSLNAAASLQDTDGRTALHLAALELFPGGGSAEIVRQLFNAGVDPNAQDKRGNTALHMSCFFGGDSMFVQELLDVGAAVNQVDKNGNSALHFASLKGKVEEVQLLITNGALLAIQNRNGLTALRRAETAAATNTKGAREIVSLLTKMLDL